MVKTGGLIHASDGHLFLHLCYNGTDLVMHVNPRLSCFGVMKNSQDGKSYYTNLAFMPGVFKNGFIEGDFDSYVSQIRKTHVWGGDPELLMAFHVLQ
ncbi:hypothetical protein Tco_1421416 [Tanacetum coccineum]